MGTAKGLNFVGVGDGCYWFSTSCAPFAPNGAMGAAQYVQSVDGSFAVFGRWGSASAEEALWGRLQRFHEEWTGREDELRSTPDYRSRGARGVALEQALVLAIAGGRTWICPPKKLAQIAELIFTRQQTQQIETWAKDWNQGSALINPNWFPENDRRFSVLQYPL